MKEGQTQEPGDGKFYCQSIVDNGYACVTQCDFCKPKSAPPPAPIKTEGEDENDFDLLAEYDMKEKFARIVAHVLNKVPEDNKENFLVNYMNGLLGSAILHHHNRYVKKLNVPDFKTTFK